MTPFEALMQIRNHPRDWMRNHYVLTARARGNAFGVEGYFFGNTGAVVNGQDNFNRTVGSNFLGIGQGTRTFLFTQNRGGLIGGVSNVTVIHVPVVQSTALAGYNAVPACNIGGIQGSDIMVTTLLNGCSFCISTAGGGLRVAHIQPFGGITAAQLCTNLQAGSFAGGGAMTRVYGVGNGYDHMQEDVSIIGVRRNGAWRIYAQRHHRNVRDVVDVTRIYH